MCNKYFNGLLAIIILVFSFWQINASKWIIIVAAIIILINAIIELIEEKGICLNGSHFFDHKTGEEIFVEKKIKSDLPSKKEVKESIIRKNRIKVNTKS